MVATVRHLSEIGDLPAALKLLLDVTKGESANDAVKHVVHQLGRIDVYWLVNKDGFAV